MNKLLEVVPTAKSKRVLLTEFKQQHGILTHCATREVDPWIALQPVERDKGKSLFQIMAESCRLYDEDGLIATGASELKVVRQLCKRLGIECRL